MGRNCAQSVSREPGPLKAGDRSAQVWAPEGAGESEYPATAPAVTGQREERFAFNWSGTAGRLSPEKGIQSAF